MNKQERHRQLLRLATQYPANQLLSTRELAEKFAVSEMTIRRDLQELADAGKLKRRHGGLAVQNTPIAENGAANPLRHLGIMLVSNTGKFANPFFNEVLEGADQQAQTMGYRVVFVRTALEVQTSEHAQALLTSHPVSGIVFIGREQVESYDYLQAQVRAVVYCGGASGVPDYNSVSFDGYHGMMNMVQHLHSLGYRRIGYITGGRGDERQRGYQDTVRALGLPDERALVANIETGLSGWLPETGAKGAQQLMTQPHPPEAIICASDRLAMGANQWLQQNGLQVPHEIALTGFDNILESEFAVPPLTTVHVHKRQMGALAVQRLIHALEHPDDLPLNIIMPTHLVIRESCGVNLSRT